MQPAQTHQEARPGTNIGSIITTARLSDILHAPNLYTSGEEQALGNFPLGIAANSRETSLYIPFPRLNILGIGTALAKKMNGLKIDLGSVAVSEPWLTEEGEAGWLRIDRLPYENLVDDFTPEGTRALQKLGRRVLTAREATITLITLFKEVDPDSKYFLAIVTSSKTATGEHVVVRLYNKEITFRAAKRANLNAYAIRFFVRV